MADPYRMPCPRCRARLRVAAEQSGRKIQCPSCSATVIVPTRAALQKETNSPTRFEPAAEETGYGLETPMEHVERPEVTGALAAAEAAVRREPFDPRPRWLFFSDVFNLPWRRDAVSRWGFLSAGLSAIGLIAALAVYMSGQMSMMSGVALGFFALPEIWLSIWTFSYAAACCLAIIEDTSGGNNQVRNWPDPNWRDWFARFLGVGYLGFLAGVVGYGIGLVANGAGDVQPVAAGIVFCLLFPFLLLSALEAGSFLIPLSRMIAYSLATAWWGWLVFYGLATGLTVVCVGIGAFGVTLSPFLAAVVMGPVLAADLFIVARLLGRLAWLVANE